MCPLCCVQCYLFSYHVYRSQHLCPFLIDSFPFFCSLHVWLGPTRRVSWHISVQGIAMNASNQYKYAEDPVNGFLHANCLIWSAYSPPRWRRWVPGWEVSLAPQAVAALVQ